MQVPEALQNVGARHGLTLVQVLVPVFVTSHVPFTHMPAPPLHAPPWFAATGAEQVPKLGSQMLAWHSPAGGQTTGTCSQTPS